MSASSDQFTPPLSKREAFAQAFRHAESLFGLAQLLTLDQEKAERLVEQTYARVLTGPSIEQIHIQDRRYLVQLMLETRARGRNSAYSFTRDARQDFPRFGTTHRPATGAGAHSDPPTVSSGTTSSNTVSSNTASSTIPPNTTAPQGANGVASVPSGPGSITKQILDISVKRLCPLAFTQLEENDRVLLLLCDVEHLSCADASLILGSDSETVCNRLETSRQRLKDTMIVNASPAEATLLAPLATKDLTDTLRQSLMAFTQKVPPPLAHRIQSSFSEPTGDRTSRESRWMSASGDTSDTAQKKPTPRIAQRLVALSLIVTAGFFGYIGSTLFYSEPDSDLITISAKKARRAKPILATTDRLEAQEFIGNHMDWKLSLPAIAGTSIQGVGISEVVNDVRVPVFLYEPSESQRETNSASPVTVYAYTYALLDQNREKIALDEKTLAAIADENYMDQYTLQSGNNVFIWRDADEIFVAVTEAGAIDIEA